jgi:hypothetical protein
MLRVSSAVELHQVLERTMCRIFTLSPHSCPLLTMFVAMTCTTQNTKNYTKILVINAAKSLTNISKGGSNNQYLTPISLYPLLNYGLMTKHFDDYLCYDGFIISLVNIVWMLNYLSLFPIVLVKSSAAIFSLRQERLKSQSLALRGIGLGGEPWDQLLVNGFTHWGHHTN